jgi:hypothetical protein
MKNGKAMKHIFTGSNLIGAIALLALAVGCANLQHTENLLSAAGFRTVIATTAKQQEQLKALPPDKVTRLTIRSLLVLHPNIKNISSSA